MRSRLGSVTLNSLSRVPKLCLFGFYTRLVSSDHLTDETAPLWIFATGKEVSLNVMRRDALVCSWVGRGRGHRSCPGALCPDWLVDQSTERRRALSAMPSSVISFAAFFRAS